MGRAHTFVAIFPLRHHRRGPVNLKYVGAVVVCFGSVFSELSALMVNFVRLKMNQMSFGVLFSI